MANIITVRWNQEKKAYMPCDGIGQKALVIGDDFLIVSEKMADLANACKPEFKTVCKNGIMVYTFKSIKANLDWLFVNHDYSMGSELTETEKKIFSSLFVNASLYQKAVNRPLTEKEVKKLYGLHICLNHGGKMAGIHSLSTNSMLNSFCLAHRKIEGCVCQHCYAVNLIKSRPSMFIPLTINQLLLSNFYINVDILPAIECDMFRFEAFGDLGNTMQVWNYINIAGKAENSHINMALWTKNPLIIKKAFDGFDWQIEKPENLQMIFSGFRLDQKIDLAKLREIFPFIDRVFIVWEKEKNTNLINCGKRNCKKCKKCYLKEGEKVINEALKMVKKEA